MEQFDPIPPSDESPLPESLLSRLARLPGLFTRPTWRNVLLLVAGAIPRLRDAKAGASACRH